MAVLGWWLAGETVPLVKPAAEPPHHASRAEPNRKGNGPDEAARALVAVVRGARAPQDRLRATLALAASLSPAEFGTWLDRGWLGKRDGFEATLFRKLLLDRWQAENPEELLLWDMKNYFAASSDLVREWAKDEPQRLLDFYQRHPDEGEEIAALTEIAESHPSLAMQRLREMAAAGYSSDVDANSLFRTLAEQSPAGLAAALDSLPAALKTVAEQQLFGQKLKVSFPETFRELLARPDGWEIFEATAMYNAETIGKLIGELANLPPDWCQALSTNAYRWVDAHNAEKLFQTDLAAAGFTAEQVKSLRKLAFQQMTYEHPGVAFNWLAKMDLNADDRASAIDSVFSHLQDKQADGAKLLAQLGTEEERQIARKAMEPPPEQVEPPPVAPINNPAQWLEKVASLDPETGASDYLKMVDGWDAAQRAALTAQFTALPDAKKLPLMKQVLGYSSSNLGSDFYGEMLRTALAHPDQDVGNLVQSDPFSSTSSGDPTFAVSSHAAQWVREDPAAASAWVVSLPAGQAKLWAMKNLVSNWMPYDPQAAQQWLAAQPEQERTQMLQLKTEH